MSRPNYFNERYAKRKAAGLCTKCGRAKHADGILQCEACNEKMLKMHRERRQRLVAERRCAMCGDKLPDGYTGKNCEACRKYIKYYRAECNKAKGLMTY